MRSSTVKMSVLCTVIAAVTASQPSFARERADLPAWLRTHVGEGANQIAEPVLLRARALHMEKVRAGAITNACYFAMDATRPNNANDDNTDGRFYVICEGERSFTAIPAGHGSGRNLKGVADFANGRRCAKNFGNAQDSELTAGGVYVTADIRTSFKGYYRGASGQSEPFVRSFIQFEGEGDTANARRREIGGHAAVALKGVCLRKDPSSPYAKQDGYVPFGQLVEYTGGRSNGCTSWTSTDARQIAALVNNSPTTLYIYPEAADIHAVAQAIAAGRSPQSEGLYWDQSCLSEIGAPKFWSRGTLEPIIARYKEEHPAPSARPTPLCAER